MVVAYKVGKKIWDAKISYLIHRQLNPVFETDGSLIQDNFTIYTNSLYLGYDTIRNRLKYQM